MEVPKVFCRLAEGMNLAMELSGDDREALWSLVGGEDRQALRPPYTVKYFISKLLLDRRVNDFTS